MSCAAEEIEKSNWEKAAEVWETKSEGSNLEKRVEDSGGSSCDDTG